MKHGRIFLLALLLLLPFPALARVAKVYKLKIEDEIHAASLRSFSKALVQAQAWGADCFLLELNTYGGAVDVADSMRSALIHAPFLTTVYINHQAASAGALISIACDSIYMDPAANIGSASVVDQNGRIMPEKYQSFMRSMMRATAQAKGRDPQIAEAMVGVDTNFVLNLTAVEAMEAGYCQGVVHNTEEIFSTMGITEYEMQEYKPTVLDRVIGFFLLPVIQAILLMAMIGGVFIELKTPGVGFPLALAITAAVCYFSPLFLEGFAQYWELLIILLGIVLLVLEIFVTPGFGVLGILGIALAFCGLVLTMVDNTVFEFQGPFNWAYILRPLAVVSVASLVSMVLFLYLVYKAYPRPFFGKIALKTDLSQTSGYVGVPVEADMVGREGITLTPLHPAGRIVLDGKWHEATALHGYIEKDVPVRVVKAEAGIVYCEEI